MSDEEGEGGSIFTSPLAMLAGGIVGIVILAYAVSSVLPGILAAPSMPLPPASLSAEAISGGIKLSWQHPAFAPDQYVIYKSAASGVLGTKAGEVPGSMNSYIDLQVTPGTTYYYTVHSASGDNEEQNSNQISALYQAGGNSAPPSSVGLKISEGKAYVNSRDIALSVSAVNAEDCRFKNEGSEWSAWEAFSPTVQWQLSSGDGAKEVFVQCRNPADLESNPVAASVTLDTVAPTINVSKSAKISGTRKFNLTFSVRDSVSQTLSCKGYVNGLESGINAKPGVKTSVIFSGLATKNTVYAKCTDLAGNSAETPKYPFDVDASLLQNGTRIKINGDMAEARSVAVGLSLFSQDAYECRLKNSGEDFISWEPYKTTRGWTLTYGNGHKVVYYQCRDINGQFVGEAQDDIILIRNNDGSRGGGGDSGGDGGAGGSGEDGGLGAGGSTITPSEDPSNLSISINNGAVYTNTYDVVLSLFANNARACRISEGGYVGVWEAYSTSKNWQFKVSTQDAKHTIKYECKNYQATTPNPVYPSAQDTIIYDGSTPAAPTQLSAKALPGGSIELSWHGQPLRYESSGLSSSSASPSPVLPSPIIQYNIYRRNHVDEPPNPPTSSSSTISSAMGNFAQIIQNAVFSDYASSGDYLDPTIFYKVGEASSLSWKDPTSRLINGVSYDYIVKAENQAGTESAESGIATATSDSVAPQVTVYSPERERNYQNGAQVLLRFKPSDERSQAVNCNYLLGSSRSTDFAIGQFLAPIQSQQVYEGELNVFEDQNKLVTNILDLSCEDQTGNMYIEPTIKFNMVPAPVLDQMKKSKSSGSPTAVASADQGATPVYS